MNEATFDTFQTKKEYVCKKWTRQGKLVLIRNESKQDSGLDGKLVKVLPSLFIQALPAPGFVSLVRRLSPRPPRAGRAPDTEVFLPAFWGKRRALPAAAPPVIFV